MAMEFNEIEPIKNQLAKRLAHHRNVNGVGLSRDESGWYIKVLLVKPHQWWHRKLMTNYQGARVRTQASALSGPADDPPGPEGKST